jgi:S1-C subfamily serine protease
MRRTGQDRSPADKAGVKPGDLLVAIDGKPVTDAQVMLGLIAALAPGRRRASTCAATARKSGWRSPSASGRRRRGNSLFA